MYILYSYNKRCNLLFVDNIVYRSMNSCSVMKSKNYNNSFANYYYFVLTHRRVTIWAYVHITQVRRRSTPAFTVSACITHKINTGTHSAIAIKCKSFPPIHISRNRSYVEGCCDLRRSAFTRCITLYVTDYMFKIWQKQVFSVSYIRV